MSKLLREDDDNYYVRDYIGHGGTDEYDEFELHPVDYRVKDPKFSEAWHYHLYEVEVDMIVSKRNGTYRIVGIRDGESVLGEMLA